MKGAPPTRHGQISDMQVIINCVDQRGRELDTAEQYTAGQKYGEVYHRHHAVMGWPMPFPASVGGSLPAKVFSAALVRLPAANSSRRCGGTTAPCSMSSTGATGIVRHHQAKHRAFWFIV